MPLPGAEIAAHPSPRMIRATPIRVNRLPHALLPLPCRLYTLKARRCVVPIAAEVRQAVKAKIDQHRNKSLRLPGLAVVLIGQDPASEIYVHYTPEV